MAIVSANSERCKRYCAGMCEHPPKSWLVALLVAACGAVIVYCRLGLNVSIVSTHFVYLPIVLVGLWWGRRAVWIAAVFGVLIVSLGPLARTGESLAPDLVRAFFFVLVGFSVGAVSEKAEAGRRAEETARRSLEKAQRKLIDAERFASIGQLSAGVAHEINNPLGTVLLYSHMLLKQLPSGDPKRGDLDMIVSEATRCRTIVRGLLDFARQSRVSKAPTDLAALIKEVVSIAKPRAKQAGVRVTSDVPVDLPIMMMDAAQIRQMLVNLVENAMDAAEIRQMLVNLVENGIDAVSDGGKVRISAGLDPRGQSMEIKVSDNGCGIRKEDLPKVFTPFFTTKEMGKGTGLGLAIAYGVVKMHSGDITVESEERVGTTFSVRIPLGHEDEVGETYTDVAERRASCHGQSC